VPFQLFQPISSARGVSKPMSFRQSSVWAKQVGTALAVSRAAGGTGAHADMGRGGGAARNDVDGRR